MISTSEIQGDLTSTRKTLPRESTRSRFKRVEEYKNGGAYHMGVGKWELYGNRTEPSRWGQGKSALTATNSQQV